MNLHFTIALLSLENIGPSADAGKMESQMKQSYGQQKRISLNISHVTKGQPKPCKQERWPWQGEGALRQTTITIQRIWYLLWLIWAGCVEQNVQHLSQTPSHRMGCQLAGDLQLQNGLKRKCKSWYHLDIISGDSVRTIWHLISS